MTPTYDYVIVGGGSAGAVLAARLTENDTVQVALVEAGPDHRPADAPEAMRSPNPHRIIAEPEYALFRWDDLRSRRTRVQEPRTYWRGRGLGGSSVVNGQIAIRGVVEDYDGWAAAGCRGWSFADVLPAFNRLEADLRYPDRPYHGGNGPIPIYRAPMSAWGPVDQAVAEAGLDAGHPWAPDHNAPHAAGVSPYAINSRDGCRVSTNDAYIEPARQRSNLTIVTDTLVDRVLFHGDRAVGVRAIGDAGPYEIRGREVILCAGAVHSPAILQRSGIGVESHLAALGISVVHPLAVGEGFQDHPAAFIPLVLDEAAVPPPGFRHTNVCIRYSSGLPDTGPHDMMIVAMNRLGDSLGAHVATPSRAPAFGLAGVWVNQCFSRGTVRIASDDPTVQPVVEENMLDHPSDLARLREGLRHLLTLVDAPSVRAVGRARVAIGLGSSDAELDDWLLANAGDTQHATSTCRMGDIGDPGTVVDHECRVVGVERLRVIDASVMPSVVRANTHLTAVMIGEHMAARLAATNGHQGSYGTVSTSRK